jgi:putative addiction module component (TIGR02574 family)
MADSENILREALTLSSKEKAELIDKLLSSLDKPNQEKEALWAKEAEERIDAYNQGKIRSVSLEKVLEKYK